MSEHSASRVGPAAKGRTCASRLTTTSESSSLDSSSSMEDAAMMDPERGGHVRHGIPRDPPLPPVGRAGRATATHSCAGLDEAPMHCPEALCS